MITFPQSFLFSPSVLGLILWVSSFHSFYTTSLIVSFTHLFTNGIIVNCFCTVQEGLMFTAQKEQVAWLAQQEVGALKVVAVWVVLYLP